MEWTKADPGRIGQRALYRGATDKEIVITAVSACRHYYYEYEQIYPSFLVHFSTDDAKE